MPKGLQGFQKGHGLFMNPENLKGRRLSTKTEFKKGFIPWNKDKKGVMPIPWNKGKTGGVGYWKGKKRPDISVRQRGSNHYNWKGGCYDSIEKTIRHSPEYKEWRNKVFERDNYTCQECRKTGGYLEADHIKPFALHPDLRLEILNGRTLCRPCHRKTPTFGGNTSKKSLLTIGDSVLKIKE